MTKVALRYIYNFDDDLTDLVSAKSAVKGLAVLSAPIAVFRSKLPKGLGM